MVPWNSRFSGRGLGDLEEPVERVLECLGILEGDGHEHALAVFLDRLLEVADQADPIAERPEEVVLEAQGLAAVGTDQLLLDQVDHAGLELVDQVVDRRRRRCRGPN